VLADLIRLYRKSWRSRKLNTPPEIADLAALATLLRAEAM
jgi:hypothetical protein